MISKPNKPVIFATDLYWSGSDHGIVSSHSINKGIATSVSSNGQATDQEWSAEQLFLSGLIASLFNTYLDLSKKEKIETTGFECTATGQVEPADGKMKFTFIHVYPKIFVKKDFEIEKALVALEKAKKICPLYNSINAEIIQHPEAEITKKKSEAA